MRCDVPVLSSLAVFAAIPAVCGTTAASSLTLLYQNSLNWTQNSLEHPGLFLYFTPVSESAAVDICSSLSENLVDIAAVSVAAKADYQDLLNFQIHDNVLSKTSLLWVSAHSVSKSQCTAVSAATLKTVEVSCATKLPALCTNSAPYRIATNSDTSSRWHTSVQSHGRTFTGYRDYASFRFLGIPYANPPERWEYSSVYSGSQRSFNATLAGPHCVQAGDTNVSEDCLFLNIFTPFLPASGSTSKTGLKPVMFWIHGGGYTTGTGSDPIVDGGSLASRGDVVLVTINYRLSTLGFLALDDGVINGNYGLADQITALKWVKANIAAFGGDPNHVTIFGQSAGAGSVRALLSSPKAEGLFHGAIIESNLAGADYASTYSDYLSVPAEVALAADSIISLTNCTSDDKAAIRACLKNVPAASLVTMAQVARYVVVDGTYITSSRLPLNGKTAGVSKVPTIWGSMRYDGAAFIRFPPANESVSTALSALGIVNTTMADAITNSGLFPTPNSGNATLDVYNVSSRVATDIEFRCLNQATIVSAVKHDVFPTVYAYEFDRSYQTKGYSPNFPVCEAPITTAYPNGDPNEAYFQCHSGEFYFVFGTIGQFELPYRDAEDLEFAQFILDTWTAFARTFNPNPDTAWLQARGYTSTLKQISESGPWRPAISANAKPLRILNGKATTSIGWREVEQCEFLGYPLDYYE